MSQSSVIFGTLIFAFVIYVTSRGMLPRFIDLFRSNES